jgi:transposase
VKLLRLLKSGEVRSLRQGAATLGYSERQGQRWWARYTHGGLAALVDVGHPGGSRERITPEAWVDLSAQMRAGAIGRLKDAQAYLRERWGIDYCLDGLSKLFIRHKTKRKTGRRRHRHAEAAAQAAFKKAVRPHA